MACLPLTIAGGGAEIAGFSLAFYELAVTQRREFPDYVPVHHRAAGWIRRRLGRTKTQVVEVSGTASAHAGGSAALTVARAPAVLLEDRVKRLAQEMQDLQRKQREDYAALDGRIVNANQRITDTETDLRSQLGEVEANRKENLRESLFFEKVGIGLFILGVILSVLGSVL